MKKIVFLLYSTLLYINFTVSMVLQSRQNMKKSMYLGPFQNKILFQNKFLFLFCTPFKYFSFTHFVKWANSEKIKFYFFPTLLVQLGRVEWD
jgi:hypothetical protein